ncbi:Calcium-binding and coiled-coil domain-containing protein 2 [Liparis tanakae]|uniref:Calcium-binding and coiled-coil domain-containing protein 2 n=1 Tax=Liparis tanakae TaxID=230148 RepID=A0A4Z2GEH8_9TELE|nr:Calcium-binding and coiled-coil domain-containing protein 2 [Liparis tanakae]
MPDTSSLKQENMESPKEAPVPAASIFSQVVFTDPPHSYPLFAPVTCSYTAAFQPSPRDWVGMFKVGWSTIKDYHTFVWVEPCLDVLRQESATRQTVFKQYYLPKDELNFYQFCYVDGAGQVRGASTSFCFKNPEQQIPESMMGDELMVITTQEQIEGSLREKAELQTELDKIKAENETLKHDRKAEQEQDASSKEQNEQTEKVMSQLLEEMDQMKEQKETLKSVLRQTMEETEGLKVEMTKQMEKRQHDAEEEREQSSRENEARAQEKLDRAEMKINLLQEEREELRGRVHAHSAEVATLNSKFRQQERELFKMKDGVQLLQVDLQSLEREKERLQLELQRSQSLVHQNPELQRTQQNCPEDDLRAECQTLTHQLQDAQRKLADEREEARNGKRRVEYLENELQHLGEQLEKVSMTCEHAERMSSKQEASQLNAPEDTWTSV